MNGIPISTISVLILNALGLALMLSGVWYWERMVGGTCFHEDRWPYRHTLRWVLIGALTLEEIHSLSWMFDDHTGEMCIPDYLPPHLLIAVLGVLYGWCLLRGGGLK